ncbi:DUF2252 domain-containing protein [Mucilaginibacter lutimaris]|uniref:DUF2252 domain-containing protein n=1 Tax=Mucilaginibacter lutimaris TaxID=931629 RepID=A0ABW2ZG15_9SPHI
MSALSDRIIAFNEGLLPQMLPHKYEAMAENAFRFYRGTCPLFYQDLAGYNKLPKTPVTWICGDLHLENFGSYRGENKLVYFDLNDFDEAILAPAFYEVSRLVTSIFIGFESLKIDAERAGRMAKLFLKTYSATLAKGKAYAIEPRTAKGIVCKFLKAAENSKASRLLEKRTETKKNKVVLSLENERHFKVDKKLRAELIAHLTTWINQSTDSPNSYKVKSCVFRLAGTGSIGVKRYLFLLKSINVRNQYLLIDMKQSMPSALGNYINTKQPEWDNNAQRIITIQQRMQYVTPMLLSTTSFRGDDYVIQELQPVKDSINFKMIRDDYRDLYEVIDEMAMLTASSQLRSGGIQRSATIDELMAFGKADDWQEEVLNYASAYAKKIKTYYKQYLKDYKAGVFDAKEPGE